MIASTIRQDVYQPTIRASNPASNPCQQSVLIANRTTAPLHKQD